MKPALLLFSATLLAQPPGASKYPEMLRIPAGTFQMGDHHNFVDPAHPSDEVPLHNVAIDALHVGAYPVSNRQYVEFLNAAYAAGAIELRNGMVYRKGTTEAYCETREMSDYSSIAFAKNVFSVTDFRATHPVVGVRWHGAAAYSIWLSQEQQLTPCYDTTTWKCDFTKNGYRLPTEAEWEYAARGGQYTPYRNFPWGDDADIAKANWPDSKDPYETGALPWTTPAGFYNGKLQRRADFGWPSAANTYQTADGRNGFGLSDMSGNVWQWCHDWYNRDYYAVSPARNPPGPDTATPMPDGQPYRVLRGGNWYNGDTSDPGHGRVSNRDPAYFRGPLDPNHPYYHIGFRVVRPALGIATISAASYSGGAVAPESIVAAYGPALGDTVLVKDSAGVERKAEVLGSAPTQVNFVIPAGTKAGRAQLTIGSAIGDVLIDDVAPGLFSANADGKGAAAAVVLRVKADGSQSTQLATTPIDFGPATDELYLSLYGTGLRFRSTLEAVTATIGGQKADVLFAGLQPAFPGLDQVNLKIPRTLAGRGEVSITLTVDGRDANAVTINVR